MLTTHFSGDEQGNVKKLHCVRVGPKPALERMPNSEFYLDADLVLIAIGFSGPMRQGLLEQLPFELDQRGNLQNRRGLRHFGRRVFFQPAMRGAASRWWFGPLRKAAKRRIISIAF